ncbi:MAG: MBOAT family O-acyltransferase [Eubacteriales bacterium]|nr:MBOAT family O-acyltransferase [Eubacteriales bacterium]
MVFSSMVFLCVFLPVVFGLHLLLPGMRAKNILLVIASLFFYAYGEPIYVGMLLASSFLNYLCALLLEKYSGKRRMWVAAAVAANLAVLIWFKYTGFLIQSINGAVGTKIPIPDIRMPIGISFFTFQAMSYVIDVYRGVTRAQKSFGKVLLYISFFPQLIAGPIVKYHDIEVEIDTRKQTLDGCALGIRRFIAGLCKKVLIANVMGLAADNLFGAAPEQINVLGAWVGAVSYMLQIYFDFSGYSDMAIGLGWMFGFHFKENFHYPYISSSIKEFWRRWHISLSGWFREYLYIPLGGNRRGKGRTVLNKMIVFLATGIWHGAAFNFLFWGIYHGTFLMVEEYVPAITRKGGRVKSALQHLYALLVVCVGFVFFRAETMGQGLFWLRRMFWDFSITKASMVLVLQQLTPLFLVTFAAAILASMPAAERLKGRKGFQEMGTVLSLAGLLLCILSLAGGTYNPFIYFRF